MTKDLQQAAWFGCPVSAGRGNLSRPGFEARLERSGRVHRSACTIGGLGEPAGHLVVDIVDIVEAVHFQMVYSVPGRGVGDFFEVR